MYSRSVQQYERVNSVWYTQQMPTSTNRCSGGASLIHTWLSTSYSTAAVLPSRQVLKEHVAAYGGVWSPRSV